MCPGKLKKKSFHCDIPFIVIFILLWWSGTKPIISEVCLCYENYKTLMKETEEDTNKWEDIPCSLI